MFLKVCVLEKTIASGAQTHYGVHLPVAAPDVILAKVMRAASSR